MHTWGKLWFVGALLVLGCGGVSQYVYPWGNTAPDCSYADFFIDPSGCSLANSNVLPFPVGSTSPHGNSKFGQVDMGGSVSEPVQDGYFDTLSTSCNNCAAGPGMYNYRVFKGGNFGRSLNFLANGFRDSDSQGDHDYHFGVRCARTP